MRFARPFARTAVVVAILAAPTLGLATAGHADAPTAAGWWNFATRDGLPQPPPPPDVNDGDLLVQAGDPSGASTGSADGNVTPSAVAAVRFTIPTGASVGPLSFEVASGATAMDVRAYATSDPWKPVQNGPLAKAPAPNRSRYSLGVLSGTTLVFADISRLVPDEGPLSVVILPGATDRVVLRKPGPASLKVTSTSTGGTGTTAAPPPPVTGSTGSTGSSNGAPSDISGAGTALPPALPEIGAPQAPAVAAPGGGTPVLAPPVAGQPGASAQRPAARPVAANDVDTRYLAAAEAVLVVVTFGLLGWGPLARLAALTGNAPDKPAQNAPAVRGVGRFVGPRDGAAVRL